MNKFLTTLEEACHTLGSKIPAVNYGGCGFVANEFAKKLEPILGKENVKIRYLIDWDFDSTRQLTKVKKKNSLTNLTSQFLAKETPYSEDLYRLNSHIVCTIKYQNSWYVLEAGSSIVRGLKNYTEPLSKDSYEIEELTNFLNHKQYWNSRYNRWYNRVIKKVINNMELM